jgi:hypothetical protein
MITWTAAASSGSPGTLWYRFRAREITGPYQTIRDFGPLSNLNWTTIDHEGFYEIEVTARNVDTGEIAIASSVFQMLPIATGSDPVISPTSHPLVFLASTPPCPAGARTRVRFNPPQGARQVTPPQACRDGQTSNFYVAGLAPDTPYTLTTAVDSGSGFVDGPALTLTSGDLPDGLLAQSVVQAPSKPVSQGLLLVSPLSTTAVATDLFGDIVWYNPTNVPLITRPEPGGYFLGIIEGGADLSQEVVREFDLVGTTILETNVARVNEQLAAMGKRQISSFHHEARKLPGGGILVLASVEQILTDVQGPGPVDVIGDMIIVLDSDLQVVWTWDTFDHLDTSRMAVLGETCLGAGACAPYFLAPDANDWTHGNALQLLADGNLLYSSRHQDWVIKIDYANGGGAGDIIWKLGNDGDFRIDSNDPYPWFSHQHEPNFLDNGNSMLAVFDNGNTRITENGGGNSRGQVLTIDETNRVVSLALNADLGMFSLAVGSAQKLADGDYHFDAGFVLDPSTADGYSATSFEVDPGGNSIFAMKAPTQLYRSFRMSTMYNPN